MINHALAQKALRTRLLTLSSLPAGRAWENVSFTPTIGAEYITEQYVPGTVTGLTAPIRNGVIEDTGLYVITFYSPDDTGYSSLSAKVSALLALFSPGTTVTLDDGITLTVRSDVGPKRGQFLRADTWMTCPVTIPWRAYTTNSIS